MSNEPRPPNWERITDDEDAQRDYEALWALVRQSEQDAEYDVDAEWQDLADRLDFASEEEETTQTETGDNRKPATPPSQPPSGPRTDASSRPERDPVTRQSARWTRIAATAMVLLGVLVGGGAWWWNQPVRVTAPAGTQQTVTLAGGSEVHLNGATTLTYPRGWGALPFGEAPVRRVRLEGEAFFEVTSGRPFRVQTANATVEVLGTAFNVRARRQDGMPTTDVTVRSGQVRVSTQARAQSEKRGRTSTDPAVGATDEPSGAGSASDSSVVLSAPGHYTQVRGSRARPTPPARADLKYATAWRTGGFAVRNAALSTVLRELEARFGTSLRLAPGVDTGATDSLTLFYGASAGLENILSDIGAVQNLSYRKHSQGYEFVPRN